MGNEIEIKDLDVTGTSFLPSKITDIDGLTEIYSLEDEFAKTKKNRNLVLYLSIGIFFALVIGSAFIFSIYIQSKNQNVEINISEFEDLRLKEVIDSARSHENNLDLLLIKLEILKVDRLKQILEVQRKYFSKELAILARDLPPKTVDNNLTLIRTAEKREITAVNRSFKNQILEKEKEIESIKAELAAKEAAKDDSKSDTISNVDRLNKLKMEELKKSNDSGVVSLRQYYENYTGYLTALYNPTFRSPKVKSILNDRSTTSRNRSAKGYHPIYQAEGIINPSEYNAIHRKTRDNRALLERLQRIPYKNSVLPALEKVSAISGSIETDYERLLERFAEVLIYKNQVIGDYQDALDYLSADVSENGFIINADDSKQIHLRLNPVFEAPINKTALIFRDDNEYIGKIKITALEKDNVLRARVLNLAPNKSIQPFDKILLELN